MVPPVLVLEGGAAVDDDGPRRRHGDALLGPEGPQPIEAQPPLDPRHGRQRNVAMEPIHIPFRSPLQPLRPGPGLLRRVPLDPTREVRGVPGPVRDGPHGGPRREQEHARGRNQLRRLRRVQHGREVQGARGARGALLYRGVHGRQRHGGRPV